MIEWKRRLCEAFPDHLYAWEEEDSIYLCFSEVYEILRDAVRKNDVTTITKCFDFAQWCHEQDEKDLWNAAGVSFYEHLPNDPEVEAIIHEYLRRDTFECVSDLLDQMCGAETVQRIRNRYRT